MAMYYNGKKVRNLYYNGKCITRLALGKEMTRLVEGDDFVRAQWLITENSNGDLMMSLPLNTNDFSLKRRILELDGNCYHFLDGQNFALQYFTSTTRVLNVYENGVNTFSSIAQTSFGEDIEIKSTNDSLTFDGEAVPIPDSYFTYLRFKKSVAGTIIKISTSAVDVDGVERYIPCRLLRPIPAALDANGIARNAGDCGMFDAVSGKFYGNVANSGTFTVEPSLVEGVDYERHKWLKGDGTAYIDTLVKNLTNVHYVDILISVDGVSSGHHIFFGRESVAPYYNSQVVLYYVSNRQNISIWGNSVGHEINFADIVGNVTLNFDTNIASTPTDSVDFSISNYNSAFSIFLFASNNNGNAVSPFIGKIKKLEIDNILNLVPCRLLRPIPASLDANGIARNADECGMYNLNNGLFYGNVANDGTFTVSDTKN